MLVLRIRTKESIDFRETLRAMKRLLKEEYGFFDVYIEGYECSSIYFVSSGNDKQISQTMEI
jgi:hypothetical protein